MHSGANPENFGGGGGGGGRNFELIAVVAILVLLEQFLQFLGKFCLAVFPLNLSVSPNNAICSYIFDYACLGREALCSGKS